MTQVKLRNKGNGLTVECDPALAKVLLARGGWAKATAPKAKPEATPEDTTTDE